MQARNLLFNVSMVADVVFAVAVVAIAPGTVPEFQIGMGYVSSSADCTAMGVGSLRFGNCCLIGPCFRKRNNLGTFRLLLRFLSEQPPGVDTPGNRNDIQHILAKEEKIVGKGNNGEEVIGEGIEQQSVHHQRQIKQGEYPCFDRDDKKKKELRIWEKGGVTEEQTQIQITHICLAAKNHAPDVHHKHTAQIEQIESKGAPEIFHGPAQTIITEENQCEKQNVAMEKSQRISEQPPNLSLQNSGAVKNQKIVENGILGELSHQIDQCTTQTDVQHQIGNAFIPMLKAEAIKISAKIFQEAQLL